MSTFELICYTFLTISFICSLIVLYRIFLMKVISITRLDKVLEIIGFPFMITYIFIIGIGISIKLFIQDADNL